MYKEKIKIINKRKKKKLFKKFLTNKILFLKINPFKLNKISTFY